jgi:hypothetical protein
MMPDEVGKGVERLRDSLKQQNLNFIHEKRACSGYDFEDKLLRFDLGLFDTDSLTSLIVNLNIYICIHHYNRQLQMKFVACVGGAQRFQEKFA